VEIRSTVKHIKFPFMRSEVLTAVNILRLVHRWRLAQSNGSNSVGFTGGLGKSHPMKQWFEKSTTMDIAKKIDTGSSEPSSKQELNFKVGLLGCNTLWSCM
jgi:hypothetical protein